jgi:CHAD domain-containing protein
MKSWEHTLAMALTRRMQRYTAALKRCQRSLSESSIHASRIEARRLDAELNLLRSYASAEALEKAQKSIKRHRNAFDPLRDAQVELLMLKQMRRSGLSVKPLRKIILKREHRCRRNAKRRIADIKIRRTKRLVESMAKRLAKKARNCEGSDRRQILLFRVVNGAFARVAACRKEMNATNVATIHRMRVAFKEFRYMIESLQPLLPQLTKGDLAAMKAFQGLLGELQDTDVFIARVDKLIRKKRLEDDVAALFRKWLLRRRSAQVTRCLRRADAVFAFWPLKSNDLPPEE